MKKHVLFGLLWAVLLPAGIRAEALKVEPAFWWSDMKNPQLQLMVYGKDIATYRPSVDYPGVHIQSSAALESPNYLLVYLDVAGARSGTFRMTFTNGKKKLTCDYELKERREKASAIKGFDASDVLYLIMPDRFANGDPSNDQIPLRQPYEVNRNREGARHGGDLAGVEQRLDYIEDLGVTAIWLNPVLENDMEGGSYHGYATTDYFKVDPRLGTNDDYVRLIDKAHQKGMKVVMDMIFNHCGSDHPWMRDVPSHDWFNNIDRYMQTNHTKEAYFDPYVSTYDFNTLVNGWFVTTMPDLNQKNPHVATYLIQNSIWWIEYSGVDGVRQDTYPYADFDCMNAWCRAIETEYPDYTIVGESWMNYTIGAAYWQKGSRLNFGKSSELKSVMDFRLMELSHTAFSRNDGLSAVYEHLCYDYVYPDISNVLRFLDNHDSDRFLPAMPDDLNAFKQGIALLLTIPGIPQIYYGTELLMYGTKEKGDGYIRLDVPGGWPGDTVNRFEPSGRTAIQNEAWTYMQNLLKWRKGNKVISAGAMKHFAINQGVYVYERSFEGKSVLVVMNGRGAEVTLSLDRYAEVLRGKTSGRDIITHRTVLLDKELKLASKQTLVMEM
jgi:glycosidase